MQARTRPMARRLSETATFISFGLHATGSYLQDTTAWNSRGWSHENADLREAAAKDSNGDGHDQGITQERHGSPPAALTVGAKEGWPVYVVRGRGRARAVDTSIEGVQHCLHRDRRRELQAKRYSLR